jgi:hypothetical protein
MQSKPRKVSAEQGARMMADMHREQKVREKGYRERALSLFPHVCASCGREFSGKRLKELTVHHKNHDHDHNPPVRRSMLNVRCSATRPVGPSPG